MPSFKAFISGIEVLLINLTSIDGHIKLNYIERT